jgi:hypothetical protein
MSRRVLQSAVALIVLAVAVCSCSRDRIVGRWVSHGRGITLTMIFRADGSAESVGVGTGGECNTMRNTGMRWTTTGNRLRTYGAVTCTCLASGATAPTTCWGPNPIQQDRTVDYAFEADGTLTITVPGRVVLGRTNYRREE